MYQHVPQLYNVNHAIHLLACIPILKLTRLQIPEEYPQVLFTGRKYASRNLEPLGLP